MVKRSSTGKLLRRKGVNFFTKVDVSTTNFADEKISWDFNSHGLSIMVESSNPVDIIQYSFDGKEVHGDLTPMLPSEAIIFDDRHQNKIWLRLENPGPPVRVRVETWRNEY